jgi:hypothetical protein
MGGIVSSVTHVSLFGQPELGRYEWLPDVDVATACWLHLRTLCELVRDCYGTFGLVVDPDQIYTAEGLAAKGWTLEDVEEQLGFPRGWTNWGPDGAEKDAARLGALRRQVPMSGIGPLLAKYLDVPAREPPLPINGLRSQ